MKKKYVTVLFAIIFVAFISYVIYKTTRSAGTMYINQSGSHTVNIVAAENFYGDVTRQLGGSHVSVLSILSDPNADPHEYESSVRDAQAVAKADLVIKNGDGYDTWIDKLLAASPNAKRTVLTGADIADHKLEDNPHVWYGIDNIKTIAARITASLKLADPADASEYDKNLITFISSLQPIEQKITDIKKNFSGTSVGLTETIYLYQTQQEGLNVLTPLTFERAIAEGNDPSADDVAKADDQITSKRVKVLIYNEQTITPVTTNLENDAKKQNIPIIPVTETMPTGKHYQSWMLDQLTALQNALQSTK